MSWNIVDSRFTRLVCVCTVSRQTSQAWLSHVSFVQHDEPVQCCARTEDSLVCYNCGTNLSGLVNMYMLSMSCSLFMYDLCQGILYLLASQVSDNTDYAQSYKHSCDLFHMYRHYQRLNTSL